MIIDKKLSFLLYETKIEYTTHGINFRLDSKGTLYVLILGQLDSKIENVTADSFMGTVSGYLEKRGVN